MAEVIGIVLLDEIVLGYYAASCGNFSPTFLYNVSRRKESLHCDVMTEVLALRANTVQTEGWIETILAVSPTKMMEKRAWNEEEGR
jgi:hypothetical protein